MAIPAGYRKPDNGTFLDQGNYSDWWTATEITISDGWFRELYYNYKDVGRYSISKNYGFSVRCVRDTDSIDDLSISLKGIDFDEVKRNSGDTLISVYLKNTGSELVSIDSISTKAQPFEPNLAGFKNLDATIAPDDSIELQIILHTDTAAGLYQKEIMIYSSGKHDFIAISAHIMDGILRCEAMDDCGHAFITGGDANWIVDTLNSHDGVDAMTNESITHYQQTWLETTVEGPGMVKFHWKVSSEYNWDYLTWYIDGDPVSRISGETDWTEFTYLVSAGQHTLDWLYSKDGGGSDGNDAGWVDQFEFITASSPMLIILGISDLTASSAEVDVQVEWDGGSEITNRGICWNTTGNPTTGDNLTNEALGDSAFTSLIDSLSEGTRFFVRAWASNAHGTGYSEEKTFYTPDGTMVDKRDGQSYNWIKIGYQLWMTENLRATAYSDGTPIQLVEDDASWANLGISDKACSYYDNDSASYAGTYGVLYNWAAAMNGAGSSDANPSGIQGVCPDDWHIPGDEEWKQLERELGMSRSEADGTGRRGTNQGSQLAYNANLWEAGALKTDTGFGSSQFMALPGGYRLNSSGYFSNEGYNGDWWSATAFNETNAWYRELDDDYKEVSRNNIHKNYGFNVRCISDIEKLDDLVPADNELDFGYLVKNSGDTTLSVYLRNTGTDVLSIDSISNKVLPFSPNLVGTDSLKADIAAGDSIELQITLHSDTVPGIYKDEIMIYFYDRDLYIDVSAILVEGIVSCEALDNCNYTFVTGGNAGWILDTESTHDGVDALRSEDITHSQSAWVETTVEGIGKVNFWWNVSSEQNWDYLKFYIDHNLIASISGETGWAEFSSITADGEHTLRWIYIKDSYGSSGSDAGWIDQVEFITESAPVVTLEPVTTITASSAYSGGGITWNGNAGITAKGVCWNTTGNPTIADDTTSNGAGEDAFISRLQDLAVSTTYYVRAYATNEHGTGYSEELSFVTPDGYLTDQRDGQSYNFTRIGNQIWMAENLAYLPQVDHETNGSATEPYYYVYGYEPSGQTEAVQIENAKATDNYQQYGVLYNWQAAMNGATSSTANPSGVQGVCPEDWHLPGDAEWTDLYTYIRSDGHTNNEGAALKSTSGWYSEGNGTDNYNFTGLPGGWLLNDGWYFYDITRDAYWWSATETDATLAVNRSLYYLDNTFYRGDQANKAWAYSVRCVRDTGAVVNLTLSTNTLDFGSRDVKLGDTAQTLTLKNTKMDTLFIRNLSNEVANFIPKHEGIEFRKGYIPPFDSLDLQVTFSVDTFKGTYLDTLWIYTNGRDTSVMLSASLDAPLPAPLVSNDTSYCEYESIEHIVGNPRSGGELHWFGDSELTESLGTGNELMPLLVPGTATYYVIETAGGDTSYILPVQVSIHEQPAIESIAVTAETGCNTSDASIQVSSQPPDLQYSIDGGTTYVNESLFSGLGADFYPVFVKDENGCTNDTMVHVSSATAPGIPMVSEDAAYCLGDAYASMTASPQPGGTIKWYADTFLTTHIHTGTELTPYEATGTTSYYVTQTVNGCESESNSIRITIAELPEPSVIADTSVCPGTTVALGHDSLAGTTYNWKTKEGLFSSTRANPEVLVDIPNTFYLTQTDLKTSCSNTDSVQVSLNPVPEITAVSITDESVCNAGDGSVTITAAGGSGFEYRMDTGQVYTGSNEFTGLKYGHYHIRVRNSYGCVSNDSLIKVDMVQMSDAPVLGGGGSYCEGEALQDLLAVPASDGTIHWYADSLLMHEIATGNGLTPEAETGRKTYYAVEINDYCPSRKASQTLVIYPNPVARVRQDTGICMGESLNLGAVSMDNHSYTWTAKNSAYSSSLANPLVQPVTTETYYLEQTIDSTGCRHIDSVHVAVRPIPDVPLADDKNICIGEAIPALTASGQNIQWYADSLMSRALHSGSTYNTGATETGKYTYYVTQTVDDCQSKADSVSFRIHPLPEIDLGADIAGCPTEVVLDPGADYASYSWNNGLSINRTILTDTSGTYFVKVVDANNCTASDTMHIQFSKPYPHQEICLVTVNSAGKNEIVWEKVFDVNTQIFRIYKENVVAGEYALTGTKTMGQFPVYVDTDADPTEQSYRYKISILDSCGNESELSPHHKTLHLTSSVGTHGEVNLVWENYEGIDFTTLNIYRGTSPDNLQFLTQISSNKVTFTDNDPPAGDVYYQIRGEVPSPCFPKLLKSTDDVYSETSSNMLKEESTTGVQLYNGQTLHVYPNPFNGYTIIQFPNQNYGKYKLFIRDISGKTVKVIGAIHESEVKLFMGDKPSGIYFFELRGDKVYRGKLIVE